MNARHLAWRARYAAGETAASIARSEGVSRQAVHAACVADPATMRAHRTVAARRRDRAQIAEVVAALERGIACRVCGCWVLRSGAGTCSSACATKWRNAKWRYDPEHRRRQQIRNARWTLAHAERCRPAQVRWATRYLAGEAND